MWVSQSILLVWWANNPRQLYLQIWYVAGFLDSIHINIPTKDVVPVHGVYRRFFNRVYQLLLGLVSCKHYTRALQVTMVTMCHVQQGWSCDMNVIVCLGTRSIEILKGTLLNSIGIFWLYGLDLSFSSRYLLDLVVFNLVYACILLLTHYYSVCSSSALRVLRDAFDWHDGTRYSSSIGDHHQTRGIPCQTGPGGSSQPGRWIRRGKWWGIGRRLYAIVSTDTSLIKD